MMRYFTTSVVAAILSVPACIAVAAQQPPDAMRAASAVAQEKTQRALRQEAAEERAEFSFGVRLENARHRYDAAMRKCARMDSAGTEKCGAHALLDYHNSRDEAADAFEASHAQAVSLGQPDTEK